MASSSPLTIIDNLYAGVADEAAWRLAVKSIARLVDGTSAILYRVDMDAGAVVSLEPFGVDLEEIEEFQTHWLAKELRLQPMLDFGLWDPMFDARLLPPGSLRKTEIYNDFLVKVDKPWVLSFWLHLDGSMRTLLTIHGSVRRGPLYGSDADCIQPLIPHLSRAVRLRDDVRRISLRSDALRLSLDVSNVATALLDGQGRVLEISAAARRLMDRHGGFRIDDHGRLRTSRSGGDDLAAILRQRSLSPTRVWVVRVPDVTQKLPLLVRIHSLPHAIRDDLSAEPRWILHFQGADTGGALTPEILMQAMQITRREAQVAALLTSGLELRSAADQLSISLQTARTHLKSIFAKTGIRSQRELVQHVSRYQDGGSAA